VGVKEIVKTRIMAYFKCNECGATRSLSKTTTVLIEKKWVVKQAECTCKEGKYMEQIFDDSYDGMPSLIRTEDSLTKKK
tara:strand:+ start:40 stop:276 length:237 start_codon:yes stop_codon:yes gene_type:complete